MRRFVSLVLIPIVIVSQSLALVAHAHSGQSPHSGDDYAAAPHFHMSGEMDHDHHADSHVTLPQHESDHKDTASPGLMALDSHDDDSIYLPVASDVYLTAKSNFTANSWVLALISQPVAALTENADVSLVSRILRENSQTECAHRFVGFDTLSLRI